VFLVLAGVEGAIRGDPVDRDQGAVEDDVCVPGFLRVADRLAELRGAGREQGDGLLDVPSGRGRADPEPGRQVGERLAFAEVSEHHERLLAGFSFRQREPIEARWRRMIPAAKVRVLRDNGSAARSTASSTGGFLVTGGDTPPCDQTATNPSQAGWNWLTVTSGLRHISVSP
jgi:hypothetical protein